MDLYRVGVPSMGETWRDRFSFGRSTGGLGAGVYTFRDRAAAEQNIERTSPDKELFVLENVVENPIQPQSRDATDALVKLSRMMDLIYREVRNGAVTYEELLDMGVDRINVELSSSFGAERGVNTGTGTGLSVPGQRIILHTPELSDRYDGFDPEPFINDFIRATRTAGEVLERQGSRGNPQPINHLLWPEFDGVAPDAGAGGNTGTHGCVIFKEKVDECVGRRTEFADRIEADELNACFR